MAQRSRRRPAGRSRARCRDRRAATPPTQRRYWSTTGWSRPMRARSSAMRSGVTSVLAPSMIATASPGIRRIIRKTMTETPNRTSDEIEQTREDADGASHRAAHAAHEASGAAQRGRAPACASVSSTLASADASRSVDSERFGHHVEALHVAARGGEQRAVGEVGDRPRAGELLLHLVVGRLARGRIEVGARAVEQLVELRDRST